MRPLVVQHVSLEAAPQAAALGRSALDCARARSDAILCTYTLPGDVLSLGRYHVVPAPEPSPTVSVARRLTGGRIAPSGDGFVGVVLALPHVKVLVADAALDPAQILNRYVRGVLGALEALGVAAVYPGRDRITVGGRIIATLGFEVEADGATLIDGSIAIGRSFAQVSTFADRADPTGVVPIELVLPEQGTSIAEVARRTPDVAEIGVALATGYARRLGVEVTTADVAVPIPAADPSWLDAGRLAPHLDRHALARDMLGVVEVYAACRDHRVAEARLCGDFIAPSGTVARLEEVMRGSPVGRDALRARVADVLAEPGAFLLGVRSPATIADLAAEACGA
jgi:hypothetical protein